MISRETTKRSVVGRGKCSLGANGDVCTRQYHKTNSSRSMKDDSSPRKTNYNNSNLAQPGPPPGYRYRPLTYAALTPKFLSGIGTLSIGTPQGSQDVDMLYFNDIPYSEKPRKRAAIRDGISAGSASPFRNFSTPPPLRRSRARPTSRGSSGGTEEGMLDPRPRPSNKQLSSEDTTPVSKTSSVDPSDVASIQSQRSRAQVLQPRPRKSFSPTTKISRTQGPTILDRHSSFQSLPTRDDSYDIIMQPETRPIFQEQLVAEVKGIYAGLVMA